MSRNLEDAVRPFQSPTQSPGFRPPATAGANPDPAATTIGEGTQATRDVSLLRNTQLMDHRLWPTANASHLATEDVAAEIFANGFLEIDVSLASVVLVHVFSTEIELSLSAIPELPSDQTGTFWAQRKRVRTIEVILHWTKSASSRSVEIAGVRWPEGAVPEFSEVADSYDVLVFQKFSSGLVLGELVWANMRLP